MKALDLICLILLAIIMIMTTTQGRGQNIFWGWIWGFALNFAQGPYVAARTGLEPMTLRTKGDESTNEPPSPKCSYICSFIQY